VFLFDVVCQKLSKLADILQSYSKNKSDTFFIETRCRNMHSVKNLYKTVFVRISSNFHQLITRHTNGRDDRIT